MNPNSARFIPDAEWEKVKDVIVQLYWTEDRQMSDVMKVMSSEYDFDANERQYRFRFEKWELEKYVSQSKMRAISVIRDRRRLIGKETEFTLCGRPIPADKIDRWEKRHKPNDEDNRSGISTPPGIGYRTPGSSTPSQQVAVLPSPGRPQAPGPCRVHSDPEINGDHAAFLDGVSPLTTNELSLGYQQPNQHAYTYSYPAFPQLPPPLYPNHYPLSQCNYRPGMPPANPSLYVSGTRSQALPLPPQAPQPFGDGAREGHEFQYSQCTGRRKAVLIGINYFGQRGQLSGCINDVRNVSAYLCVSFGYRREDMVILTDDRQNPMSQPVKENILRAMHWLVKDARPNDSLFFHYSDEEGGYDEAIYPVDFRQVGHITDSEMHRIMVQPLQPGVRLTVIFDSCNSATALDLPYIYSTEGVLKGPTLAKESGLGLVGVVSAYNRGDRIGVGTSILGFFKKAAGGESVDRRGNDVAFKTSVTKTLAAKASAPDPLAPESPALKVSSADVIMFSCNTEERTTADDPVISQATGAMSWAFITALKENPNISYSQLLDSMRDHLKYRCTPKLAMSCSHPLV
ncbi:hypothetical protein OQA88_13517 [Cercophora sp. LCS_1]